VERCKEGERRRNGNEVKRERRKEIKKEWRGQRFE
jgi:hypothetical protein